MDRLFSWQVLNTRQLVFLCINLFESIRQDSIEQVKYRNDFDIPSLVKGYFAACTDKGIAVTHRGECETSKTLPWYPYNMTILAHSAIFYLLKEQIAVTCTCMSTDRYQPLLPWF